MKDFGEIKVSSCKIQTGSSPPKQCWLKSLLLTLADRISFVEFQALKLVIQHCFKRERGMLLNLCEILA